MRRADRNMERPKGKMVNSEEYKAIEIISDLQGLIVSLGGMTHTHR